MVANVADEGEEEEVVVVDEGEEDEGEEEEDEGEEADVAAAAVEAEVVAGESNWAGAMDLHIVPWGGGDVFIYFLIRYCKNHNVEHGARQSTLLGYSISPQWEALIL